MKYLLDANMLLAAIIRQHHGQHAKAITWLAGRQSVICPLAELGFLRVSTNPRIPDMEFDMKQARTSLERFVRERQTEWIADDLPALKSHPAKTDQVTDHYLADLASKHGLKLATLDGQLKHPSVELVS